MMVSDLIDELKHFNPYAEITLTYSEDILLSYVDRGGQYNKRTTPIVFIEPCDLYMEDDSDEL